MTLKPTRFATRFQAAALCMVLTVATAVPGCSDDSSTGTGDSGTEPDGAAGTDGTAGTDGAAGQDGAGQPDGSSLPDGSSQPDGTTPTDGGGPGGDGGPGDLVVTFGNIVHWANCMPIVPPDPWHLTFDLTYDNTQGSSTVTVNIVAAKMVFNPPNGPILDVNVTPTTSGPVPAGTSTTVTHTKTTSNNDIPNDCGLCSPPVQLHLEVTLEVGGQQWTETSASFQVSCAS